MKDLAKFQAGVKNWMLRSKHGRNRIFETPDIMWQAACEYFQMVDSNPFYTIELSKSGDSAGEQYEIPNIMPFTIQGLSIFWNVSPPYFYLFKRRAIENKEAAFIQVIEMIEAVIYDRKYTGAATGHLNPQFIGKDLGLVDRSLVGSDPDNPLPAANVVQFYIPDNRRQEPTPIRGQVIEKEVQFLLD